MMCWSKFERFLYSFLLWVDQLLLIPSWTCLRRLCIAGMWSTAATRWRAPRRKSHCGFARTSFTAGRTTAATGSTTEGLRRCTTQSCVLLFVSLQDKWRHTSDEYFLALVACSHAVEEVSLLSCCCCFHKMLFFFLTEVNCLYQAVMH